MDGDGTSERAELKSRVAAWLETEGYPLEFAAARAFRDAGFRVFQSYYTRPHDGSPPREVDVVATLTADLEPAWLRVEYVVECKRSIDKPWVFFVGGDGLSSAACVAQTVASELGEALLWKEAGNSVLHGLQAFSSPVGRTAFGGRQAFSGSRDVVYDALRSVTGATRTIMDWYNEPGPRNLEPQLPSCGVVGLPVIVVEGRLFEASEESSGSIRLDEVASTRVHWRGAGDSLPHITVDVVSADALSSFAADRAAEGEVLLEVLETALGEVSAWIDRRESLAGLSISEGARGILGGPPLFRRILAAREGKVAD